MRRSAFGLFAVVLALVGLLAAGGCSTKQVRQEGELSGRGQAPGTGAAVKPRVTELSPAGTGSGTQTGAGQKEGTGPGNAGAGSSGAAGVTTATPLEPPPVATAAVESAPKGLPGGGLAGETTSGLHRIQFDFDQDALTPAARETLGANAKFLREHSAARIRIEGHCDERGTTEYNLGLGERRAKAAFQYLMDLGIDPNRMTVVSYGEEVPLDSGHTEEAWAKNRRAEFVEILQ
jgi:peptidoglycan-associated lipoprotein